MKFNKVENTRWIDMKPWAKDSIKKHYNLQNYKELRRKTAIIGDTLSTDIQQAHKIGGFSIKVEPVDYKNISLSKKVLKGLENLNNNFNIKVLRFPDTSRFKDSNGTTWKKKQIINAFVNKDENDEYLPTSEDYEQEDDRYMYEEYDDE